MYHCPNSQRWVSQKSARRTLISPSQSLVQLYTACGYKQNLIKCPQHSVRDCWFIETQFPSGSNIVRSSNPARLAVSGPCTHPQQPLVDMSKKLKTRKHEIMVSWNTISRLHFQQEIVSCFQLIPETKSIPSLNLRKPRSAMYNT